MALAGVLLLAQTLLAVHALEHLDNWGEDPCEICLAGAPLGAALGAPALVIELPDTSLLPQSMLDVRPSLCPLINAYSARAPPSVRI
jgi:hypothetical protein